MNNTLIKGLRLLEILTRCGRPMGVTELADASDMPKSGTHRLLQALVDERYVQRCGSRNYMATIKLWELGSAALCGSELRKHAECVMEDLMQSTGETVHLSVLDGLEVVYAHKVDGVDPVRAYSQIGGRVPAYCVATGKAMMAFKGEAWLSQAVTNLRSVTPRTIVEPEQLRRVLRSVQRDGYAINCGEWRLTVNGVAAPIFDGRGTVVAALGISGREDRLVASRLHALADQVVTSAQALSKQLRPDEPHTSLWNVVNRWGMY